MMKFDFFFGVMLGQTALSHNVNLSRTLQKGDISATEGQDIAEMTDVSKLYELTITLHFLEQSHKESKPIKH